MVRQRLSVDHEGDTTMAGGEDREKTMKQNITC